MNRIVNPTDIMAPLNNVYSHGVVIPAGARVLHTAGQVGARPNGIVSPRIEDQAEQLWENLLAIVRDADMRVSDIVKLTAYVVGVENYAAYASARARHLGEHKPASTAVCVPQLLKPEWLIEVELIAARL